MKVREKFQPRLDSFSTQHQPCPSLMPCLLPLGPREQHFKANLATVAMATLGESSRNTELFPETTTYLGHLPNCAFD
ncbi:hypothetical protein ALC56_10285 [Trachymyrmex septentrionalis]|uniref:Uncharacterized protein n=1 Tax=Trachymyrmex septentrionalis TaxID=34720 RepID=A0A195F4E4_9HYME|nr:hypothetical protein ALC56_10285 [Trachymyrmex septentrionalis]